MAYDWYVSTDDDAGKPVQTGGRAVAGLERALGRAATVCGRLSERLRRDGPATTARVSYRFARHRWREYVTLPLLRLRSDDGFVVREVDGHQLPLDLDDPGLSWRLLVYGEHEPGVEAIWRDVLEEGMVVVDVGSNFGYYTLLAAAQVGETGHVHAIEPDPSNYEHLARTLETNDLENVSTYDLAVGSTVGTETMFLTAESNWNTLVDCDSADWASGYVSEKMDDRTRETIDVETTTLTAFAEDHEIESIDAFRMDVEGYEIEITRGMTDLLAAIDGPCYAFLEVHLKHFEDEERVVTELIERYERSGFRPHAVLFGNDAVPIGNDLVETLCSFDDACPHVVLKK